MAPESLLAVGGLVVAIVAVAIAVWQARISKSQLDLAKETEGRTERALEQIRSISGETRQIVQEVKNNIDDRITKIIDSKLAAEAGSQAVSDQFSAMLMQEILKGVSNSGS